MSVDLFDISVSRGIVSLSFILNVACQLYYGLFANPSIKQLADAHHSAFSPNPYFITAFFVLQFIAQLFFVRGLFTVTATPDEPTLFERFFRFIHLTPTSSKSNLVDPIQTNYARIFALGSLLHVAWTVFWMQEWFWAALPMVIINTLIQVYIGLVLGLYNPNFDNGYDLPVHVISKLAAGVGCLGILDTAATAAGYVGPPSAAVQVIIVFLLVKLGAIHFEGIGFWNCAILFDALALCAGQPSWSSSLALAAAFIVLELCIVCLLAWAEEPTW